MQWRRTGEYLPSKLRVGCCSALRARAALRICWASLLSRSSLISSLRSSISLSSLSQCTSSTSESLIDLCFEHTRHDGEQPIARSVIQASTKGSVFGSTAAVRSCPACSPCNLLRVSIQLVQLRWWHSSFIVLKRKSLFSSCNVTGSCSNVIATVDVVHPLAAPFMRSPGTHESTQSVYSTTGVCDSFRSSFVVLVLVRQQFAVRNPTCLNSNLHHLGAHTKLKTQAYRLMLVF